MRLIHHAAAFACARPEEAAADALGLAAFFLLLMAALGVLASV